MTTVLVYVSGGLILFAGALALVLPFEPHSFSPDKVVFFGSFLVSQQNTTEKLIFICTNPSNSISKFTDLLIVLE